MKRLLPIFIAIMLALALPAEIKANNNNNNPPSKPTLQGPTEGEAGKSYTYTATSTDPDGDKIYYCFDWGDGNEFCTDMVNSGQSVQASHTWQEKGTYVITVTATDEHGAKSEPATLQVKMPLVINAGYTGRLRIYIVEPTSRWNNYDGKPYGFGFLDFAYNDKINVGYMETEHINVEWDAAAAGYGDVKEDNIMAVAAVFNPTPHEGRANPPFGNPFDAYYVDACAAAMPGEEGVNDRVNATHTVLIETGTATWCPYCPIMDEALKSIYEKGEYPFYMVALIADKNSKAYDRVINDYNLYGYPTAFIDGGRKVIVGGVSNEFTYTNAVSYCMQQNVHDLDLKIKCEWQNGKLKINVTITNLESGDASPPEIEIEKPKENYLYIFDKEIIPLPLKTTIVIGKITIKVNAIDDSGVDYVLFMACNELLYNDTEEPYEYVYDGSFGWHTISVAVYDIFGNYAIEDRNIYVINI